MTSWPHRILLPLMFALACGVTDEPIECTSSAVCDLGAGGSCRVAPTGRVWCAYVDLSCSGGARWSAQAGDGLAGTCAAGDQLLDGPHAPMIDAGGSPDSAIADAPPDVTPPNTTITSHPSAISGAEVVFLFESDDVTATFECSLDDGPFEACDSPRQYTALGPSPKPHVFQVARRIPPATRMHRPLSFLGRWTPMLSIRQSRAHRRRRRGPPCHFRSRARGRERSSVASPLSRPRSRRVSRPRPMVR